MSKVEEAVRSRYASTARQLAVVPPVDCCSGDASCECDCGGPYSAEELGEVGMTGAMSLGCGNPTLLARLEPGQVVLDLGSGAGLDVLLSARRVAPDGHAYGVDMTDEMLELAERNRQKAGVQNATFLRGKIDAVPLPDASVDVVISNCVINLTEDKGAVIREAFRVLKPGGLFAVADMVELKPMPARMKKRLDSWAGCISGSIPVQEYRSLLTETGFAEPDIDVHSVHGREAHVGSAYIRAHKKT